MVNDEDRIFSNACMVTDPIVSSSRNLIDGSPLTPINFADLCNLIEALVLHERVIMCIPSVIGSPVEDLFKQGIICSTMFGPTIPASPDGRAYSKRVAEACSKALTKASAFGKGIIDKTETPEVEQRRAWDRLYFSKIVHRVESGAEIDPSGQAIVAEITRAYGVYKEYVEAVYQAARHFHIPAYSGTTELFLSIENSVQCVPRVLYDKLCDLHHEKADRLLIEAGYRVVSIPPFALIVLSRCRTRDDIVPKILEVRDEFHGFRATCTSYSEKLLAAQKEGKQKDLIAIHRDFDQAIVLLTEKVEAGERDTRFLFRVWDVLKSAQLWGIAQKLIDKAIETSIEEETLARVEGIMDVWHKLAEAPAYNAVLHSDLFPGEYDERFFKDFQGFVEGVRASKGLPHPDKV